MPGAATQVFSREFDAALARVPGNVSVLIRGKIAEMGRRLGWFLHYRMKGRAEFRLRVGDYRMIYDFDTLERHALLPIRGNSLIRKQYLKPSLLEMTIRR
jgi:mRNA-degrading endonuclease RelE of RelBE toxin-antitoxin system